MTNPQQCDFLLMRYVPDPFKNEFVNIGVMLLARECEFADVRFARNWSRVSCLDPHADLELLNQLEADIREQLNESRGKREKFVYRLQDTLSTGLQLSEPGAVLSESPQQDLDLLARTYLEVSPTKRQSKLGARQKIVAQMQEAFESAGVWDSLNKKIRASKYTHPGDSLISSQ